MKIEVSNGEIADKLTILQIKLERIKDVAKLKNLRKEYDELARMTSSIINTSDPLYKALYDINCELWDIEDHIRDLERRITNLENILNVQFSKSPAAVIEREIRSGNAADFLAAVRQSF